MGGGTRDAYGVTNPTWGLSPRGRGNPWVRPGGNCLRRSIPAWAGEPPRQAHRQTLATVYPRVGGGTRNGRYNGSSQSGLSPRGRGNRRDGLNMRQLRGSIPAWAGEPSPYYGHPDKHSVYPRVGGGTFDRKVYEASLKGLSPRGRGNRQATHPLPAEVGSIPAWAGEPSWPRYRL